jgi:hypothetical protein
VSNALKLKKNAGLFAGKAQRYIVKGLKILYAFCFGGRYFLNKANSLS